MIRVFVLLRIVPEFLEHIEKEISDMVYTKSLNFLTGRYDAIVEMEFPTVGEGLRFIHEKMMNVEGVIYTETLFELPPL